MMKMFLYSFVRDTFLEIEIKTTVPKINDVSLRNDVFNECRI